MEFSQRIVKSIKDVSIPVNSHFEQQKKKNELNPWRSWSSERMNQEKNLQTANGTIVRGAGLHTHSFFKEQCFLLH